VEERAKVGVSKELQAQALGKADRERLDKEKTNRACCKPNQNQLLHHDVCTLAPAAVLLLASTSMRLRTITPALPYTLVTELENCGIRTEADLLFNNGTVMQIFEKLPHATVTLVELEECIKAVTALVSSPWIDSGDLLAHEEGQYATYVPLSTGIPQLDKIINGLNGPQVLEVSGDHGTGKSVCIA
jgi:hypothetical protein